MNKVTIILIRTEIIYSEFFMSWTTGQTAFGELPRGLLAPEAKKIIPEVVNTERIMKRLRMVIKAIGESENQPAFYEENYYLVDPSRTNIWFLQKQF